MIKTITDLELNGKRALVRCDFNVPLKDGIIQDDTRIREAIASIKCLLDNGAAVILMSHLGRAKGQRVPELSLKPVSQRLSELLGTEVKFSPEAVGDVAVQMASELKAGDVMLLENLRFYQGEESNDPEFAKALASLADVFVQDAFGTVHRKHASMTGVPGMLPAAAGLLLEKEIKYLSMGLEPQRPLVVCLGGAKLETKIPVIENMLDKADTILIGGGMAYTLLKAQGKSIGKSLLDEESLQTAQNILAKAQEKSVELLLPVDHIVTDDFENPTRIEKIDSIDIPDDYIGVDIGEKTRQNYSEKIVSAKTIVLNGPMGVFENREFSGGTKSVFESIVKATKETASSIAGGGDTVSAIKNLGFDPESFTHVSTGGGASLKFLEGRDLPGIKVLDK
jgi:3-phosphoglycerate kinase